MYKSHNDNRDIFFILCYFIHIPFCTAKFDADSINSVYVDSVDREVKSLSF